MDQNIAVIHSLASAVRMASIKQSRQQYGAFQLPEESCMCVSVPHQSDGMSPDNDYVTWNNYHHSEESFHEDNNCDNWDNFTFINGSLMV